MEFWGIEVKAGETLKSKPNPDSVIHLSQAALGEAKKDKANENIILHVKVGDQKLVMGTLSSDKFPQLSFDVVFDKEFEFSHNWKHGSIYLCGYQSPMPVDDENDLYESSEEEDDIPLMNTGNGKPEAKDLALKPLAKPKGKNAEALKTKQDTKDIVDDEDDSDEGEDESDEGAEDMSEDGEEDDEDDSEEETPKKADAGKKRGNESGAKVPAGKKAKIVTPQKTDGKKGNATHTATPHPAKKPAAGANKQTPKSGGGQFSCKSCDRSFNSDTALQSHAKAKHN